MDSFVYSTHPSYNDSDYNRAQSHPKFPLLPLPQPGSLLPCGPPDLLSPILLSWRSINVTPFPPGMSPTHFFPLRVLNPPTLPPVVMVLYCRIIILQIKSENAQPWPTERAGSVNHWMRYLIEVLKLQQVTCLRNVCTTNDQSIPCHSSDKTKSNTDNITSDRLESQKGTR